MQGIIQTNLKVPMKFMSLSLFVLIAAAIIYNFTVNTNRKEFTESGKQTIEKTKDQGRTLSNAPASHQFVQNINEQYLLQAHDQASFKSMLNALQNDQRINTLSKNKDRNNASYPVAIIYSSFANLAAPLEGFVWKLGGVARQSEFIYKGIIESFTKIAYNKHLYSKTVAGFMEYLAKPAPDSERFESISDVQNFLANNVVGVLESSITQFEQLLNDYPQWNSFQFDFDWALAVNGDFSNNHSNGRYDVFTRAHLERVVSYMKNTLATIYYFNAFNLDELPTFLNESLWTSVKGTKVQMLNFRNWFSKDARNMHLMTPNVYRNILFKKNSNTPRDKYKNFLTLKSDAESALTKSHQLLIEAIDHDINYMQQMYEIAEYPNQEQYLIDTKYVINDPALEPNRLEKISQALRGESEVTDPVSGESVVINLPVLFTKNFAMDLKQYLPNGFEYTDQMNNARINVNGQPSFLFSYARPNAWPDPSLKGVLPGANNNNLYSFHRILTNSGDLDVIGNIIFYFLY